MIKLMKPEEVDSYLARLADELARTQESARRPETKDKGRPPVPPLVDQIRDVLATLPPSALKRISLPMLIPMLKGRYRTHPNVVGVARALRQLGFVSQRSWKAEDRNTRYWNQA